jgi:hypothetical protein
MGVMPQSLYNAIEKRIQLRIVNFNLKCDTVNDLMGGYEKSLKVSL